MNFFDPQVLMYAASATMVVVAAGFVMSIFADSVKTMHRQSVEHDRRKKELERAKK